MLQVSPSQTGHLLGVGYAMGRAWVHMFAKSGVGMVRGGDDNATGKQLHLPREFAAAPEVTAFESSAALRVFEDPIEHGVENECVCAQEFLTRNPGFEAVDAAWGTSPVYETGARVQYRFVYRNDLFVREILQPDSVYVVEVKNRTRVGHVRSNQADLVQLNLYLGLFGIAHGYLVQCVHDETTGQSMYAQIGPLAFDEALWSRTHEKLSWGIDWHLGKSDVVAVYSPPAPSPGALPSSSVVDDLARTLDAFDWADITERPVTPLVAPHPFAYMRVSLALPLNATDIAAVHQLVRIAHYLEEHKYDPEVTRDGVCLKMVVHDADHWDESTCAGAGAARVAVQDRDRFVVSDTNGHRLEVSAQHANVYFQEPQKARRAVVDKFLHVCLRFRNDDSKVLEFVDPLWRVNLENRLEVHRDGWGGAKCTLL
jgi:hypothetical protein